MKTIQKLMLAGTAAMMLLLAGCADGPHYIGPYYKSPYYAYYGPYYYDGGAVVLNRNFHGTYYRHGIEFAHSGSFHGGHGHSGRR